MNVQKICIEGGDSVTITSLSPHRDSTQAKKNLKAKVSQSQRGNEPPIFVEGAGTLNFDVELECQKSSVKGDADLSKGKGQFSLGSEEGGFQLLANGAARIDLLRALRAEQGFALEIAEGARLGPPLTARLLDAPLDDVLALALAGAPHALRYQDLPGGPPRLVEVRVGTSRRDPDPQLGLERPPRGSGLERPALSDAEHRERYERRQAERTRVLSSADPAARAEAAAWIHVDHRTLPLLGDALLGDEVPAVRAAAAETLGEATEEDDEREAADLLIQALDDRDKGVVLAALEALESVGDASVIPRLEPLLEHPEPEVREQALITIEWVED